MGKKNIFQTLFQLRSKARNWTCIRDLLAQDLLRKHAIYNIYHHHNVQTLCSQHNCVSYHVSLNVCTESLKPNDRAGSATITNTVLSRDLLVYLPATKTLSMAWIYQSLKWWSHSHKTCSLWTGIWTKTKRQPSSEIHKCVEVFFESKHHKPCLLQSSLSKEIFVKAASIGEIEKLKAVPS